MSRVWSRRNRAQGLREYLVKALLVGIPVAWFVFAMEMTVLSVDRTASLLPTPQPHPGHRAVQHFHGEEGHLDDGAQEQHVHSQRSRNALGQRPEDGGESAGKGKDVFFNAPVHAGRTSKPKRRPIGLREDRPLRSGGRVLGEVGSSSSTARSGHSGGGGGGGDGDGDEWVDQADAVSSVRFDPPRSGEHGQPVHVNPNSLTWQEKAKYDAGYNTHNFNQYVSDMVSLQRTVPDYRHEQCGLQQYKGRLQPASVIMCFYNEAWSTLLRSVHSVLDRSPPNLLKELILVDDFSDLEHLQADLDNYMASFPKVKILRMPRRVGLVRARLRGVEVAQGPILIFLDSHIECGQGWMEPLVWEVSRNRTAAVAPIIDIIDKDTLAVVQAVESVGVVDLTHMVFTWNVPMPRIQGSRTSPTHAFMSPTMAGGLFAINKDFFLRIGTWDPGLVVWGGENLELSFKLWMCGGSILIHPCSHVSHIFRDKSPYLKASVDHIVKSNSARVAEVWLDDYKRYFFRGEQYDAELYGDVSDRKQLRQNLSCHSFRWFIDHVYPEMFIDGAGKHMSQIMSSTGLCLRFQDAERRALMLHEDCAASEVWQTTQIHEIRNGPTCLEQSQGQVFAAPCDTQQQAQAFRVVQQGPEVTIVHVPTGTCVTAAEAGTTGILQLAPCMYGDRRQLWTFQENSDLLES